jgi:hypothetical protein
MLMAIVAHTAMRGTLMLASFDMAVANMAAAQRMD